MLLNEQIEQNEDSEDFDDIPENDIVQEVSDIVDGVQQFHTHLPFTSTKLLEMMQFIKEMRDTRRD